MTTIQKMSLNEPVMKRNEPVLIDLPSELYTILANYKIPSSCKYSLTLILVAYNQK